MLFSNVLHPPVLSLFSSTGSHPMQLWDPVLDADAVPPASSCVQLIHDSASSPSLITPPSLHSQRRMMDRGHELHQTVLHIQSPNLSKTFIQCPPRLLVPGKEASFALGLKYPCIHLHVRNLGKEWSFEVGIVDAEGRLGVLRLSTFQVLFLFSSSNLFSKKKQKKTQETSKTHIPTSSSPTVLSSVSIPFTDNMDPHQLASTHVYSLLFSLERGQYRHPLRPLLTYRLCQGLC